MSDREEKPKVHEYQKNKYIMSKIILTADPNYIVGH
jgi:hypothetical protein